MARIAGVNIPTGKRVVIGLQYIHGIGAHKAKEICEKAELKPNGRPKSIAREESDRLFKAINATKLMRPPTDCIVPIGEELLLQSL